MVVEASLTVYTFIYIDIDIDIYIDIYICIYSIIEKLIFVWFGFLKASGVSKRVKQFHFTAWPDHGVPNYPTALLHFRKRIRSKDSELGWPIAVHCRYSKGIRFMH